MPLPAKWAAPEDFATLFRYLWHRDFPIDPGATGARRADWTIHIGVVVRSIADLMGLVTRFERGGRKDAVLRSTEGDEIAVEWEWEGVWGKNELGKLKSHRTWRPKGAELRPLAYGVLITYTHTPNVDRVREYVSDNWAGAGWPLLLVLIDVEDNKSFSSGKEFKSMRTMLFNVEGEATVLSESPSTPWGVAASRWSAERLAWR